MGEPADTGLPVEAVVADLIDALATRRRAVLTAEPGAGKSTVAPLRLLAGLDLGGRKIVMLEPRRLAARACAARMARLLGESVGDTVGVTTRDDRRVGPSTRVEVVTEGVLTRRLQSDPTLDGTGLVIFDEFHERNLQGDLGLALLLDSQATLGGDIAILVMSATIDAPAVAAMIGRDAPAPIVESAGRTYPVDIEWQPRNRRDRLEAAVARAVDHAVTQDSQGDVLVFLPGMAEIRRAGERLAGLDPRFVVHRLHGSLPLEDQDRAVAPADPGFRKIVLSTDIAESSLTVEGVDTVIDAGLGRAPRFDPSTGLTRLSTISISRASADQRSGRAGRLRPGRAIRLWSKIEHGTRPAFAAPDLTSVDLAGLRLELAEWGTQDPAELAFMDPVPARAWSEAGAVLEMLGAIGESGRITERGRRLARLPLHPRLAAVVEAGNDLGLGAMAAIVAALVDERDVLRGRPGEVPVDLAVRLELIADPGRRHPQASGRALSTVRRRATDLARRAGVRGGLDSGLDVDRVGLVCAAGFPDRVAQRRGSGRGRFRLRSGSGVRMSDHDTLAGENFIVAVDVDGAKKDARVRLAAGVDPGELPLVPHFDIEIRERLMWSRERNDLVIKVERFVGALDLGAMTMRPTPSDEVTQALIDHVKTTKLSALTWTEAARGVQDRVAFLAARRPNDGWPDLSDRALLADLSGWLAPLLVGATGRADIEVLSVTMALDTIVGFDRRRELDRLAPTKLKLASGRSLRIDYRGERPLVASRAQDFYRIKAHPTVLIGAVPITVELLSPANRPIQRTSDLIGFWSGSWSEVRKDMAGRYPKHDWPVDPSA